MLALMLFIISNTRHKRVNMSVKELNVHTQEGNVTDKRERSSRGTESIKKNITDIIFSSQSLCVISQT